MTLTSDGYRSDTAGELPDDGAPVVAGVQLPGGHLVRADRTYRQPRSLATRQPVLWITDGSVPGVGRFWAELQQQYPETGLWPLVLHTLDSAPERPWDEGELDPSATSAPDDHAPEAVLRDWWAEGLPIEGKDEAGLDELAPFGRTFPGLASASTGPVADDAPRRVAAAMAGRLGLVAVRRPADAVATLGWLGPINHFEDMGMLAAVLRSWEDRYGAVVVGIGFDTLTVAVRRPPSDDQTATALAAEHLAACSDNIWQGAGSIADYAATIRGQPLWSFWWD
ncbi:MAG: DUF4253 domain-containing protein [Acidimicrobiales bacterium]